MHGTAAFLYMVLIVLPETIEACYQHVGSLIANGTVSTCLDVLGRLLNQGQGFHGCLATEHIFKKMLQLGQPHTAWHALAAGLRLANLQEGQLQIHRAKPRRRGNNVPLQILVQLLHRQLHPVRSLYF